MCFNQELISTRKNNHFSLIADANEKNSAPHRMRCFRFNQESLLPFAQLLVAFVAELGELLGLGEQFLGLLGEGLHERVVTYLTHDELLEVGPVGFLGIQVEAVLAFVFLGGVEAPEVPVTAVDGELLFHL